MEAAPQPGTVRIGPAGWSYKDWEGIVYPSPLPKGFKAVAFLSGHFDTLEVNSSFYRQPSARHAAAWVAQVQGNPRFMFTAKLWQGFTHLRDAWPGEAAVREYLEGVRPMVEAGRLGTVLAQFPWSFRRTPENRLWLARVADAFAGVPLVLELRHTTWETEETYAGLRERGIGWCNIDQPVLRDCIAPGAVATAEVAYVRLHGRNHANWFRQNALPHERYDYLYSADELGEWLPRIESLRKRARQVYVVNNNHFRGQAVANGLALAQRLGLQHAPLPPLWVANLPR